MTDKPASPVLDEAPRPGESFLARLHRRKTEARQSDAAEPSIPKPSGVTDASLPDEATSPVELTDADMPPVDSLTIDSDYSGFLSDKVSESLRRMALRKLFHQSAFNVIDELDEYAEDFTTFEALGDIVTADMRHRIEVEARKRAEASAAELLDGETSVSDDAPGTLEAAAQDSADVADQNPPADGASDIQATQTDPGDVSTNDRA